MARECRNLMAKWCKWLINLVFLAAYYSAVMLLSRKRPTFYIDDFHVFSLNKTLIHSTSAANTTTTVIYFDLRIQNENEVVGIYYDNPLNLTFTYFPPNYTTTNTVVTIGEYTIRGFYQGNAKIKHVRDSVVVQDLFSAVDHRRGLAGMHVSLMDPAKVVVFGVNLDARVKFKSIENKRSDLKAGGVVEVNGNTGNIVQKKTMELEYESGSNKWGVVQWLLFFPLVFLFGILGMGCVYLPVFVMGVCIN